MRSMLERWQIQYVTKYHAPKPVSWKIFHQKKKKFIAVHFFLQNTSLCVCSIFSSCSVFHFYCLKIKNIYILYGKKNDRSFFFIIILLLFIVFCFCCFSYCDLWSKRSTVCQLFDNEQWYCFSLLCVVISYVEKRKGQGAWLRLYLFCLLQFDFFKSFFFLSFFLHNSR